MVSLLRPVQRLTAASAMMLLLLLLNAALSVEGFSLQQQTPFLVSIGNAPLAPPHSDAFLRAKPQQNGSRRQRALFMSDVAYDDLTTTVTPLDSTSTELSAEEQQPVLYSTAAATQQIREIDWNEVINHGIVAMISVAVIYNMVAPVATEGLVRGWTIQEVASHIAAGNWAAYTHVLQTFPIATKAVTSATVYTIGDVISQRTQGTSMGDLDRPRVVRSLLAGLIGHGPMSHYWYQISEHFFDQVAHLTQWWSFIPKVVVDQTIWGPIWNNSYILLLGLMKLENPKTIVSDMKKSTIPLVLSGLKLWPLAHCVTYGLIPVDNRLLWVDFVEIFWVTILASQAAGLSHEEHDPITAVAVDINEETVSLEPAVEALALVAPAK